MRPIIGLSMALSVNDSEREKSGAIVWLKEQYIGAILQAGGLPWPLPSTGNASAAQEYAERIEGLVVTGGDFDIDPKHYGQENAGQVRQVIEQRTAFERAMLEAAWQRRLPILGICGGEQLLNVFLGGTLEQHIDGHEDISHTIQIEADSLLCKLLAGKRTATVGSTHHQAVKELGKGLRVSARTQEGVIEAIEATDPERFCLGVQWHPEQMIEQSPSQLGIYLGLMTAARAGKAAP